VARAFERPWQRSCGMVQNRASGRVLVSDREADEPGPRYDMY
jgi:hypothetical protein